MRPENNLDNKLPPRYLTRGFLGIGGEDIHRLRNEYMGR